MEPDSPRRHRLRQLLVTLGVITVLVILYASPRELRNAIRTGVSRNLTHPSVMTSFQCWDAFDTIRVPPVNHSGEVVHVLLIFANVNEARNMREKLAICLGSLLALSSVPLRIYIVTDRASADVARQVLADASAKASSDVLAELLHMDDMLAPLEDLVSFLQPHFSAHGYFGKKLFFLSTGLHRLFPEGVRRLILLDPVYRHCLHKYRQQHPGTLCGEPAPRGNPGLNSGVVLIDLEAVRSSSTYKKFLTASGVQWLVEKYSFEGTLGDQDFYSLLSWEFPELFYVLPCTWNRQLCEWWRHHGYADVFDEYYRCNGTVHIYHGNCNSSIPSVR
ncbi:hypothetical protein MTO96_032820 [Rhipicephalus appendiculatus]